MALLREAPLYAANGEAVFDDVGLARGHRVHRTTLQLQVLVMAMLHGWSLCARLTRCQVKRGGKGAQRKPWECQEGEASGKVDGDEHAAKTYE